MQHSNNKLHTNKGLYAFLALFIIPISGFSIDIYVPSLPAMVNYFHSGKSLVQLSITIYMIGLAVMQLFAGAITDSFGRRKPFLISMLIFIAATLCIPFTTSIYQLLFLRILQGTVVAMIIVSMRSVIPDLFKDKELYKMSTYMTIAWSIGPIIAPAIGGYLQHYFGWKANFYFLSIYSIIALILVAIYLPETSQHRHDFKLQQIFQRYTNYLTTWDYSKGLIINGILYSIVILFSIVGPFLVQNVMHYSAIEFGHYTLLVGLAWFLGTVTNRFLLDISISTKSIFCFWGMFFVALIMLGIAIFIGLTLSAILVPLLLLTWLGAIVFPSYFAHSLALFPQTSGTANALFGSFIFLIAGISSGLGTFLKSNSQLPLSMAYVIASLLCLIALYVNTSRTSPKPQ